MFYRSSRLCLAINIHIHTYIYMHITTMKKKDLNFKGNKEDILEDLGRENM